MTPVQKLQKRIQVHDKYAIAAGLAMYDLEKKLNNIWAIGDSICSSIIQYYNDKGAITDPQIKVLKGRLPKYAAFIIENTDISNYLETNPSKNISTDIVHPIKVLINDRNAIWSEKSKHFIVQFKYDPELVAVMKTMPGTSFNNTSKRWKVKRNLDNAYILEKYGFAFDSTSQQWLDTYDTRKPKKLDRNLAIKGLKLQPKPFQIEGVQFIHANNGRALIADEMGLGKTIQAIAWLQLCQKRPSIIVCPASLKYNWAREISKWINKPTIYVINGKPKSNEPFTQIFNDKYLYEQGSKNNVFVIINYDIIANNTVKERNAEDKVEVHEVPKTGWVDFIIEVNFQCIVIDECHYLKNKKALRTACTLRAAHKIPSVVMLTGTPILNRPSEFYNIINLINPYVFPNFMDYATKYCDATHGMFGWDFSGASNTEELNTILTNAIMIRRLKKDVLKELPEKVRSIVPIPMSNMKEYNKASEDLIQWYTDKGLHDVATNAEKAIALTRIQALRKLSVQGKLKGCIEWIKDFIENDEKIVVFCIHHKIVDALMDEFKHIDKGGIAVSITGDTKVSDRQRMVDIFQENPKCKLFVGNIDAAGVGLTLTASSNTCFIEFPWTPALLLQAEDRVHRYGQTADSVNAWYLVGMNTIDEELACIIDNKLKIANAIIDGADIDDDAIFSALLKSNSFKSKRKVLDEG